ncbi:MAG: hypothetical protein ACEPOZ_08070 [Marinifilaceae bacterium]
MRKTYIPLLLSLCLFNISAKAQQRIVPEYIHPHLTKIWESPQELKTPESVLFDSQRNILYVSNVNGKPSSKDGNGFISKLNPEGKIIEKHWITGLDAPKGMARLNNLLYVSDINRIAEIDIEKGKIIRFYEAPTSRFLNDLTSNPKTETVFISDPLTNQIYQLKNEELKLWLEKEQLAGVNGLFYQNEKLFAGTSQAILKIDTKTKVIHKHVDNSGGIDGLVPDGKGNWIVSDWKGNIYRHQSGSREKLLRTEGLNINAADIEFIPKKNLLLVPTFFDNRVVAYQLKQ